MAGKQSRNIWYVFAVVVALSVIGLVSEGNLAGMQVASAGRETTPLNNAIEFLRAFGFFNVVLPFLLIFAIVFGVLEKSKLFGMEKVGKEEYPRRNLNAIIAFSVAFFVVAAANITGVIQATMPQVALVLVVVVSFLLLFGALLGDEKTGWNLWEKSPALRKTFIAGIFIAMVFIFLGSFGVLNDVIAYVAANLTGTFITSLIFMGLVVGVIWFITLKPKGAGGER